MQSVRRERHEREKQEGNDPSPAAPVFTEPAFETLRRQWEYSHAASALLNFAAFCLVALAVLAPRR